MTSGQISSRLDLTYAPSTITPLQPTEGKLDLLFEAMYDDFIGGQPSAAQRIVSPAQAQQVHQISDIVHATCLCARYQAKPTEKHLKEVKRIFRYLQGTVNTSLWYSKDSGFELTGFSDAVYAGAIYHGSRICVSIRFLCPSPLDADTVNGLWLSLQ
nr:uncharacterized mitochondrial protein AtMg00810-like [Tanacetum cinerariifolium]